ncbi:MAG: protease inhibitor I42 family protein [Acidimicrobiia bacterium]|nr:protease inhibitor I42 family protein [Acidimicrobiia bacterium]
MQAQTPTLTAPRPVKPATVVFAFFVVSVIGVGAIALTQIKGTNPAPTTLGPAEAGSAVAIEVGDDLTIALPANPSTGYSWVVTSITPDFLTQIGDPEFAAESDLMGTDGIMTFHFEGIAAGQGSLQLEYLRPWEDAEPLDTYTVTINVR